MTASTPSTAVRPRWPSPLSGCSILFTSPPQSAMSAPAADTNEGVLQARRMPRVAGSTPASSLLFVAAPL